jgi:alpha-beta hydrolase superfamily lysophospholipase
MLTVNFLFIGCTHIFLQPDKRLHVNPDQVGAQWKDVQFKSLDGTQLTGLWFPSKYNTPKGTVIQFHGNGENMTSHFLYVYWLALEGWNVLSFDYRGYGASHGNKSLKGSVQDGVAAIQYAREKSRGLPLCIIAQSLGGTLAITSLHRDGGQDVRAIILDSTFASFQRMAQDKLSHWWLTWALQWPLAHALISDHLAISRNKPKFFGISRQLINVLSLK